MSPSTALRPRAGQAAPWRSFFRHDLVAIVLAALAALLITTWLVDSPARVSLTVVDKHDYELTIATSEARHEQLAIGAGDQPRRGAHRRRARSIPGPEWLFRFAGQGRDGGEIAVTRDELRTLGWRFEVPPGVVTQLEEAGATPPPR